MQDFLAHRAKLLKILTGETHSVWHNFSYIDYSLSDVSREMKDLW